MISFPTGMTIPINQVKVFSRLAPEISLALDRSIMHRSMLTQAASNEAERRRIAQDLHDSLAQNIGYLRLKLDQLTGEDAIDEITEIRSDLQRMKEIADQSYDQVRETLTHLRPVESMDLEASINNFAHSIGERARFRVQFETSGRHLPVPLGVFRQVNFICQEAMVNIEKHANPRSVDICMDWLEDALIIRIEDDGIGFISSREALQGHYGMSIMNERAEEIRATLRVTSIPGRGTKILLQVPLPRTETQPIDNISQKFELHQ